MVWLAQASALAGRKAGARRVRAGLEEFAEPGEIPVLPMAPLDLALGEQGRALARLKAACSAYTLEASSPTPVFDPLRADTRIADMMARCITDNPVEKASNSN
ncbi:MAG: hypothetical protein ACREDL_12645 [Bradyrhizobium sp.]